MALITFSDALRVAMGLSGREGRDVRIPTGGQLAAEPPLQLLRLVRPGGGERLVAPLPLGLQRRAPLAALPPFGERVLGHEERLQRGPAERLLGEPDLLLAQRRAVRLGGVHLVGASVGDVGPDHDERGPAGLRLGRADGRVERVEVVPVRHVLHLPAVGPVAGADVLVEGQRGVALDGDVIVVVEADQLAEPQVAGERRRLVRGALHHVAVAGDEPRVVVHRPVPARVEHRRQVRLRDREPDGVADPLAQRSGGDLDPRRDAVLRVPGRPAVPLAELLDVVEREVVPREVERAVEQHRGVARGEDEAVAVGPGRVRGIVPQVTGEEQPDQRRQRHGRAGMTGVRALHRVHGQRADGVDAQLVERLGR